MNIFGIILFSIGLAGFIFGICVQAYGSKKHDSTWLVAGQQTSFRGLLILLLGIFLALMGK